MVAMEVLSSYAWLLGAVTIAVVSIVTITLSITKANSPHEGRPRRVLVFVLGLIGIIVALIKQFVDTDERWLWLAALLPAYFAVQHGINTAIFKNPRFFDPTQEPDLRHFTDRRVAEAVRKKVMQERRLYSTSSLALRFLLPGVILMLAILTVGYAARSPTVVAAVDPRFWQGAQLGALGGYVYVVVYVGGRTMHGDTTPASLIWSLATITAGPLLAGAIQLMAIELPAPADADRWPANATWNELLLPFAAGFSLRIVVNFVNASIRRLLTDRVVAARGDSLLRIRGITYDVEERLIEEGIQDVSTLADANPTRLRRNLRFDRRQIISWIDEALLMKHLPNTWQSLESDGITGVIDLVWYVEHYSQAAIQEAAAKASTLSPNAAAFTRLAERNKIDVAALAEVVLRMYTDGQVLLIWGLYQLEEGPADGDNFSFTPEMIQGREAAARLPLPEPAELAEPLASELEKFREQTYAHQHRLFVVHSWQRSSTPDQVADITIKLLEHRRPYPQNVRRVSYFMGQHFGNRVLMSDSVKDSFCVSVAAYRPFLCVAKVELMAELPPVYLYRYIDFGAPSQIPPAGPGPKPATGAALAPGSAPDASAAASRRSGPPQRWSGPDKPASAG